MATITRPITNDFPASSASKIPDSYILSNGTDSPHHYNTAPMGNIRGDGPRGGGGTDPYQRDLSRSEASRSLATTRSSPENGKVPQPPPRISSIHKGSSSSSGAAGIGGRKGSEEEIDGRNHVQHRTASSSISHPGGRGNRENDVEIQYRSASISLSNPGEVLSSSASHQGERVGRYQRHSYEDILDMKSPQRGDSGRFNTLQPNRRLRKDPASQPNVTLRRTSGAGGAGGAGEDGSGTGGGSSMHSKFSASQPQLNLLNSRSLIMKPKDRIKSIFVPDSDENSEADFEDYGSGYDPSLMKLSRSNLQKHVVAVKMPVVPPLMPTPQPRNFSTQSEKKKSRYGSDPNLLDTSCESDGRREDTQSPRTPPQREEKSPSPLSPRQRAQSIGGSEERVPTTDIARAYREHLMGKIDDKSKSLSPSPSSSSSTDIVSPAQSGLSNTTEDSLSLRVRNITLSQLQSLVIPDKACFPRILPPNGEGGQLASTVLNEGHQPPQPQTNVFTASATNSVTAYSTSGRGTGGEENAPSSHALMDTRHYSGKLSSGGSNGLLLLNASPYSRGEGGNESVDYLEEHPGAQRMHSTESYKPQGFYIPPSTITTGTSTATAVPKSNIYCTLPRNNIKQRVSLSNESREREIRNRAQSITDITMIGTSQHSSGAGAAAAGGGGGGQAMRDSRPLSNSMDSWRDPPFTQQLQRASGSVSSSESSSAYFSSNSQDAPKDFEQTNYPSILSHDHHHGYGHHGQTEPRKVSFGPVTIPEKQAASINSSTNQKMKPPTLPKPSIAPRQKGRKGISVAAMATYHERASSEPSPQTTAYHQLDSSSGVLSHGVNTGGGGSGGGAQVLQISDPVSQKRGDNLMKCRQNPFHSNSNAGRLSTSLQEIQEGSKEIEDSSSISSGPHLSEFISLNLSQFPKRIQISRRFSSRSMKVALSEGDKLDLHFVRQTKSVVMMKNSDTYTIPLNTAADFSILYDPFRVEKVALLGFSFKTAGALMDLKIPPCIVAATRSYDGGKRESSIEEGEILVLEGTRTFFHGKLLKVFSLKYSTAKYLDEKCEGGFTTHPGMTKMKLATIYEHSIPLPQKAIIYPRGSVIKKSFLESTSVTLEEFCVVKSVIATTTPPSSSNNVVSPVLSILTDLDAAVIEVPCPKSEIPKMRAHTKRILDTFDPKALTHYFDMSSVEAHDAQCALLTNLDQEMDCYDAEIMTSNFITLPRKQVRKLKPAGMSMEAPRTGMEHTAMDERVESRLRAVERKYDDIASKFFRMLNHLEEVSTKVNQVHNFLNKAPMDKKRKNDFPLLPRSRSEEDEEGERRSSNNSTRSSSIELSLSSTSDEAVALRSPSAVYDQLKTYSFKEPESDMTNVKDFITSNPHSHTKSSHVMESDGSYPRSNSSRVSESVTVDSSSRSPSQSHSISSHTSKREGRKTSSPSHSKSSHGSESDSFGRDVKHPGGAEDDVFVSSKKSVKPTVLPKPKVLRGVQPGGVVSHTLKVMPAKESGAHLQPGAVVSHSPKVLSPPLIQPGVVINHSPQTSSKILPPETIDLKDYLITSSSASSSSRQARSSSTEGEISSHKDLMVDDDFNDDLTNWCSQIEEELTQLYNDSILS